MSICWFNGQYLPASEWSLTSSNRAFRYGDGLFETIKVGYGKPLFFHQYYIRFIEGLTYLRIDIPEEWSMLFLQKKIEELLQQNKLPNARVRMTCWRSGKGWYAPESHLPDLLIEVFPLSDHFFQLNTEGVRAGIWKEGIRFAHAGSFFKSANAEAYVLASIDAATRHVDDMLLTNQHGRIADALYSNVFIWSGDKLMTPPVAEGCIDGVMRRVLIKYARRWGLTVEETRLEIDQLLQADEVMLTNSLQGIRWVAELESSTYSNKIASMLLSKLNELLPTS